MSSNKSNIKLTQNGKLDKRYNSTKKIEKQINSIKTTKSGRPDARSKDVKSGKIKVKTTDGHVKMSSELGKKMKMLK